MMEGVVLMVGLSGGMGVLQPEVRQDGSMRAVMRDGQTEGRVLLSEVAEGPGAIAVGALEGLGGEVTIVEGEAWVSRVVDGELVVTGPEVVGDDRAALLTRADVKAWHGPAIFQSEAEGSSLELLIRIGAEQRGLDVTRPIPFVIEGEVVAMDLHVVNGLCPVVHGDEAAKPWRLSIDEPMEARVVGFFAPDAVGVMTHHGTSIHAHAVLEIDGRMVTGHVDRVRVGVGATMRLGVE